MARANTSGMMVRCTMVTGTKTRLTDTAYTHGLMAGDTRENGRTTTCMARVFILGRMAGSSRETIRMTESKGMEYILGQMEGSIWALGTTASSTGKGLTSNQMARQGKAFGKMVEELNGLMNE